MSLTLLHAPRRRRSFFVVFVLALASGAIVLMATNCRAAQLFQQAAPNPGPAVGRNAIGFSLQTLDGKSVTLDTFRGKPLIVNFFASWCDPCRDEMPLINELAMRGEKEGYSVLGIAVEDTRAAMSEFRKEAKLVFPIALDLNSTVKRSYRIFGPPATFFIDGQGIIRDIVLGPITRERALEALKKTGAVAKN
ncbi:MAG TPA: TlpA disulfide reductase family protein [Candidatus Binatia bacterium]|jgi:peroxiredoxin